jgi:hypothetical protein
VNDSLAAAVNIFCSDHTLVVPVLNVGPEWGQRSLAGNVTISVTVAAAALESCIGSADQPQGQQGEEEEDLAATVAGESGGGSPPGIVVAAHTCDLRYPKLGEEPRPVVASNSGGGSDSSVFEVELLQGFAVLVCAGV